MSRTKARLVNRLARRPSRIRPIFGKRDYKQSAIMETHHILEKNLGQKQADKFMKRNKLLSEAHFGSEKIDTMIIEGLAIKK